MASYQKYVMMGVTMILLPLGKLVLKKMMGKLTEESEQDSRGKCRVYNQGAEEGGRSVKSRPEGSTHYLPGLLCFDAGV